jgi:hypothetical protein
MTNIFLRLGICLFPLALTPLWGYLIAESYLNFGAGEKDLVLLVPWILWSLLYLVIFVMSWLKHVSIKRGFCYSAGGATAVLLLAWFVMFFWFSGLLGVS